MYMKAIFVNEQGDGYQTNVGADFGSEKATKEAFDSIRPEALEDISCAHFIIDLWGSDGDLLDSLGISKELYTKITGAPVLSEEEYRKTDEEYWAQVELKGNMA